MIFSPLDALLFRRRPRAAQCRVEIFVGAVMIVVGTPCAFFAETSLPKQICFAVMSFAGGVWFIVNARRDAQRESAEASAPTND
jgi:undecaprenyl pyrophosphate phosphatase UppP